MVPLPSGSLERCSPSPQTRDLIQGRILTPEDPGYDAARTVFLGDVDRRPALIARPTDAADVARVIALARDSGAELAVRGGGHSPAGHSASDGGVVLDLRGLRELDIDLAAPHRLGRRRPDRGRVHRRRRRARARHRLRRRRLGRHRRHHAQRRRRLPRPQARHDHRPAARGRDRDRRRPGAARSTPSGTPTCSGRSAAAAATSASSRGCSFQLHDVSEFTGGILVLPASADVLDRFLAEAEAAPDALSTIANVMGAPPMPFLPPEVHGRPVVLAMLAWTGDADAGERALAPFRALAEPLADMVRPMPYTGMYQPADPRLPPGRGRPHAGLRVATSTRRPIVDWHRGSTRPGGSCSCACSAARWRACRRTRPPSPTADARIIGNVVAMYADPADGPDAEAWVAALGERLYDGDGAYAGFLRDEGEAARARRLPGRRPGSGSPRSRPSTTRTTCSGSTRTCRRARQAGLGLRANAGRKPCPSPPPVAVRTDPTQCRRGLDRRARDRARRAAQPVPGPGCGPGPVRRPVQHRTAARRVPGAGRPAARGRGSRR